MADLQELIRICSAGTAAERLAAVWMLDDACALITADLMPQVVTALFEVLHRSELLSFTWMMARGHLYKLEVEEDPLFVDLRRRGITREEFDRLDAAQRQAELEARLPAPVPVDTALDAIAREMEGGAAWSPAVRETLGAAASSWRDQRDHSGLATVHDFAARLSPCPVSLDRKSTRLNSSHTMTSRMPSSA